MILTGKTVFDGGIIIANLFLTSKMIVTGKMKFSKERDKLLQLEQENKPELHNSESLNQPDKKSLWHHRDFRHFWAGETVSLFGTQITYLALPLTAILTLGASSWQLGLLNAAQTLPFLLLSLPAGIWVDRHKRRPTLVLTNLGRAGLMSLIPVLAWFKLLGIEVLCLVTFLVGSCTVFFEMAYQSYLPRLVEQNHLIEANSKLTASASTAEIGGPGLSGLLVNLVGAPFAILLDTLSYLFSAWQLKTIQKPEPQAKPPGKNRKLPKELGEGFQTIFSDPRLKAFAGEAATYNIFWNIINTVLVLFVVNQLGLTVALLGFILSAGSVGALIGAIFTGKLARRLGVGKTIIGMSMLGALPLLIIPLASGNGPFTIFLLGSSFFLSGVGVTGCNVHVYSLRQSLIPDELLGRTNSVYRLITYGFTPLGALMGGLLAENFGLYPALWVGAGGVACSWLWLFFSPVRKLHSFPVSLVK